MDCGGPAAAIHICWLFMKRLFIILLLCSAALIAPAAFDTGVEISAQEPARKQVEQKPVLPLIPLRTDFRNSIPIPVGERLEFEIKYSRFPIYATVGIVTFEYLGPWNNSAKTVSGNGPEPPIEGWNVEYRPGADDKLLRLRATAISKGILIAILGIDVRDRFESLVNGDNFSARMNLTEVKEGKKHTVEAVTYDVRVPGDRYRTTDLANPNNPPKIKEVPHEEGMMSLLSAFYFVRFQRYKEGQMIRFPVSSDENNYVFDIVVARKEKLKTDCGNVKTVVLEPKLFGPGKFFNRQGEMSMWMTDDRRHMPLRLVAKTSAGTITARLLNFKNNCKIEDPQPDEEPKKSVN